MRMTRIRPALFYYITVFDHDIKMGGYYTNEVAALLKGLKFRVSVEDNGNITFTRKGVIITLT